MLRGLNGLGHFLDYIDLLQKKSSKDLRVDLVDNMWPPYLLRTSIDQLKVVLVKIDCALKKNTK